MIKNILGLKNINQAIQYLIALGFVDEFRSSIFIKDVIQRKNFTLEDLDNLNVEDLMKSLDIKEELIISGDLLMCPKLFMHNDQTQISEDSRITWKFEE